MRTLRDYKSGTVGKKRDSAVFWYKFEKNRSKCVGTRAPPSFFSLLGTIFWPFAEDRAKRPTGMKARLARSLGGFLHVVNKGIKSGMMRPST